MNQTALQVVTWGVVASVVATAVALAISGDARQADQRRLVDTAKASSPPTPSRDLSPVAFENPTSVRTGGSRSWFTTAPRAQRGGGDS